MALGAELLELEADGEVLGDELQEVGLADDEAAARLGRGDAGGGRAVLEDAELAVAVALLELAHQLAVLRDGELAAVHEEEVEVFRALAHDEVALVILEKLGEAGECGE